ncbi:hypothetical protein [Arthrobacter sp. UYCu712]|uniref:hypothetical protein n=1 Tax=Arthrobacter sp. UYCu712 TaxID=3156340 RepID=UPI0033978456
MQYGNLEQAEQHCPGLVPRELKLVVLAGDARDKAEDADQEEHRADGECCLLNDGPPGGAGVVRCSLEELFWIAG